MKTVAKIAAVYIDVCSVSVCSAAKQHTQHSKLWAIETVYNQPIATNRLHSAVVTSAAGAHENLFPKSKHNATHTERERERERETYLMSLPGQLRENTPRHAFRQLQLIRWLSIRCTGTAINDVGYLSLSLSIDTVSSLSGGDRSA